MVWGVYRNAHHRICKAVGYTHLMSIGDCNGLEIRSATDVAILFNTSYEVGQMVINGDYDKLLNDPYTLRLMH